MNVITKSALCLFLGTLISLNVSCYLNSNIAGLESLASGGLNSGGDSVTPVTPATPILKVAELPTVVPEGYPYHGMTVLENVTGSVIYSLDSNTCNGLVINSATGIATGNLNHLNTESCSYKIKAVNNSATYTSPVIIVNINSALTYSFSSNEAVLQKGGGFSSIQLNVTPAPPFDADIDYQLVNILGGPTNFIPELEATGKIRFTAGATSKIISVEVPGGSSLSSAQYQKLNIGPATNAPKATLDISLHPASLPNFQKVESSTNVSCGITSGKLYCWGRNTFGEIGNGTGVGYFDKPTQVGTATNWQDVAVGGSNVCGIESGKAYCWGTNSYGQVGNGGTANSVVSPTQVGASTTWEKIATSGSHTCGINAGRLYCWGLQTDGMVGNGATSGNQTSPVQIGASTTWTGVTTAEGGYSCGINAGKLYCWGSDFQSGMGNGAGMTNYSVPTQIGALTNWQMVSGGNNVVCGIESGKLFCWGSGFALNSITQVGTNTDWTVVGVGSWEGCGIRSGQLYCWNNTSILNRVGTKSNWQWVNGGNGAGCGIESNRVNCWSTNTEQTPVVGDGPSSGDSYVPIPVDAKTSWQSISSNDQFACGIDGGKLYCWGANTAGQLGIGNTTPQDSPVRVGTLTNWQAIATYDYSAPVCGIESGKMYCWGYGLTTAPVQVGTGTDWTQVDVGSGHMCGIASGKLYCWGSDIYGQIGNGAAAAPTSPQQIGSSTTWQKISAGFMYTCGIDAGKLYCWGFDTQEQLGNGGGGATDAPAQIGASNTWQDISAGVWNSCGIDAGKLYCWGSDFYGVVGDGGGATNRNAPVQVGSDTTWLKVAVAKYHACGIKGTQMYCWGESNRGVVGQGAPHVGNVYSPVLVLGGLTNWTSIVVGENASCGINNGSAQCWGKHHGTFYRHNWKLPRTLVEYQ